jgi:hypothetical protein
MKQTVINKKQYFYFLFLFIIINLVLGINNFNLIKENKKLSKLNLIVTQVLEEKIFLYVNSYIKEINKKNLPDSVYANNEKILVYRFFKNECEKCVINDLSLVMKELNKNELSKFLIINNKAKNREEKISKFNMLQKFNFISVEDSILKISKFDTLYHRYFAVLDNSGYLSKIFFPDNNFDMLTTEYLQSLH